MTFRLTLRHNMGMWLTAVVLSLVLAPGCRQEILPTPTPVATALPPVGRASGANVATASGVVVPVLEADLGFPHPGRVQAILVDVGSTASRGELLAVQDAAAAEASVSGAEAALFRARAQLAELQAGPREQEIAAAQARVDSAAARLAQLSEVARSEEIDAARASLAAEQSALQRLFSGPREAERIDALAALSNAEAALKQAQAAYDEVSWRNDISGLPESRQLQQATNDYEAAKARFDALYADPDIDAVASARARVQQAQAALDALLTPGSQNQIAEAEANLRGAQAELELLTEGARNEAIGAAAAAVSEAEAVLQNANAALAELELRAPFSGTVTALYTNTGETIQVGQTALTLADLEHLRVQTTDLSERDVDLVSPGQRVRVYIEPLGDEVGGHVVRIAQQATVIGGDVVFEALIDLDEQLPGVRWGMSVDVNFLEE